MVPDENEEAEQLILRRKELTNLEGINFAQYAGLRVLSVSHNNLVDISPICQLPTLEELNVNQNQLTDLSPAVQCPALRVLLAAKNQVDDIDGLEALNLRRLSLFRNLLPDLEALLVTVQAFPQLESLDLGGNPCFQDAAQRHGVVRALPGLKELDGEVLTSVDRQLAIEFFACAEEAGLEGRPGTSCGLRPKTAPVHAARAPDAPVRGRERSSSRRSRGSARSPSCGSPITDNVESIARFQDYVQALQLRLQTTQVECENLTRQIQTLRQEAQEPALGTAALRAECSKLEAENLAMHRMAEQSRQLRAEADQKEALLAERHAALGLSRPGSRGSRARPGTAQAAVDKVLGMSQSVTAESLRAKSKALRQELEMEHERTAQLRAKACSKILGRDISPPPRRRLSA